jgi:ketosteroid isomerase-like protein
LTKPLLFASPEECERAFYDALESGDAEAMADLWLQDDDVCCVHPGAARSVGYSAVRSSWAAVLSAGAFPVRTIGRRGFESPTLAVSNLIEQITVTQGSSRQIVNVIASNAYVKTPAGWKMIMHVGMAAPEGQVMEGEVPQGTVH